jgi:hypothetical protein
MTLLIGAASDADAGAIGAFNQRLRRSDVEFQLPESPDALLAPRGRGAPVWHEMFVARDEAAIRGGYLLKRELLRARGADIELGNYQIPLSEGVIDKSHAMVGIRLFQHVMQQQSTLYCLGMGSMQRPLPRLLARFSWTVEPVPFFFRVIRASAFLENITYLQQRRFGGPMTALARYTGAGALAVSGWRVAARLRLPAIPKTLTVESTTGFGAEIDALYAECRDGYGALIERTAAALDARLPRGDERLIRILVRNGGKLVGWLVLTRSQLRGHKQFGSMRLGCIVDGLCAPELAPVLVRIATERLIAAGVDLIVSNQSHTAWLGSLRRCGYLEGPSNFIFARSPALTAASPPLRDWHLNRGDGDGPINL